MRKSKGSKPGLNRKVTSTCVLVSAFLLGFAGSLIAGETGRDWPQWRGPKRDGISTETGILKSWPEQGPTVKWRVSAGEGYSAMSVVAGRLYTAYGQGSDEVVVCLDTQSGRQIWRQIIGSKFTSSWGNGPRSTPTLDGGVLYTLSAKGILVALDAATGNRIWKHDLKAEYGAKIPRWGVSTSPLIYKELVVVDVGGRKNHGLMAFDKASGKAVWGTKTERPGYSAPIAVTVDGIEHILNFTGRALISVDPQSGKKRWRYGWRTSYDVNAATPVFVEPDRVFISSGYDKGAAMLKIDKDGVTELWKSRTMRNHFSSSIWNDGYVYGFDNATLRCIDAGTQETRWAKRGLGKGSLIYADGHLIVLSEDGRLLLVEAGPGGFVEKASAQMLDGRCWILPTLSNGHLYIRNEKEILCLKFSEQD